MTASAPLTTAFGLAPTWLRGHAWRRPGSGVEELFAGGAVADAVRAADAAGFDLAFRPDALAVDPVRAATAPDRLGLDPVVQAASLAAATTRIRFVPTVSATFAEPFDAARRLVSLEQLTGGRVGWNIVTSLDGDGNFHTPRTADSEGRWRRAAEFVDVVEALRASFPADAVVADREAGVFVDPERMRPIDHEGEFFRVAGPLPTPSVQPGRLPLLQAGASPAGLAFAAERADYVFTAAPDADAAVAERSRLRELATAAGRAGAVRVLAGLSLVLAESRRDAVEAARGIRSPFDGARRRERLASAAPPELHWSVVGTPDDAAASIAERVEAGAIDGFVAFPGDTTSVRLVCERVMPLLAARGLVAPAAD
ncbi:LLM class flavin-dependent oxidoreductase [Agromyces archimandritae]|uniref:LLM class flavin-dependent oxidoreductase n=1 Tax=Agromyces archimandritae TaxID=2781962 RepID=A0A975INT7_9MICO|nr:LLM class flavin-dependent oxidoreductase [Agromyces archimandritae]QTX04943.1 LLM class flavin-dependent oxidoreductase [Agromyces archimandritae]